MTTPDDGGDASRLRHELRTPINHILGYAELLMEDAEDGGLAEASAHLLAIRDHGKQLLNLVPRLAAPGGDGASAMRAHLDQIAATCALLEGDADAPAGDAFRTDLGKIRAACARLANLAGG